MWNALREHLLQDSLLLIPEEEEEGVDEVFL